MSTNLNDNSNISYTTDSGAHTVDISNFTTTNTFIISQEKKIENVEFIENEEGNFIEVISSMEFNYGTLTTYPPTGRTLIKERYGVKDGKITLLKTISGTETPGYYVGPTISWEE